MVSQDEINAKAKAAVMDFDDEAVEEVCEEAIDAGVDVVSLIQDGLTAGMNEIGDQFEQGTLFLPHVIAASEAMSAGVAVLTPVLEKQGAGVESKGKIAIGTIEGDIHTIGKDIVATMLKIAGFQVIDLGRDVPIADYVAAVKEHQPLAIGSSALMTTTMVLQMQVEEQLKEAGLRDSVKTMVGGAPVTQDWADKIGADIYAENATDAVVKCKALVE
ncbi:B12-binding domain-containing protein [Methanococcoides methylutens]|uniref:Trimethylamine methyltransferase corrinoid protein n=1 Tax=Methanococcoides methylutens MM1 TaxID=1434104 RepID=A0A0E3STF8_METMT|nr:B12-binding domain-containing protein [Methanococcoides methylutens]AKB85912.1 Trimethylamine methyltransferase corrinoid protein [Methanococcoides methylutens MM1]